MTLHLITGTDTDARKSAVHAVLESIESVERYELSTLSEQEMVAMVSETPLFSTKRTVLCDIDGVSEDQWNFFTQFIKKNPLSDSLHLILEGESISAIRKKKLPSSIIQSAHDLPPARKTSPRTFAVTDAFLTHDKRALWLNLHTTLLAGEEIEQIHGALLWQVKSLALAHDYPSAQEAGMSPYVFTKSKKALGYYSREMLSNIMITLLDIAHTSRTEGEDFVENMEKWVLGL